MLVLICKLLIAVCSNCKIVNQAAPSPECHNYASSPTVRQINFKQTTYGQEICIHRMTGHGISMSRSQAPRSAVKVLGTIRSKSVDDQNGS